MDSTFNPINLKRFHAAPFSLTSDFQNYARFIGPPIQNEFADVKSVRVYPQGLRTVSTFLVSFASNW